MENDLIARTGRVQNWSDDPTTRLPVSCTASVVEDSMEGPYGIETSWRYVSHRLRFGAGVAVHLRHLPPALVHNENDVAAFVPISFAHTQYGVKSIL